LSPTVTLCIPSGYSGFSHPLSIIIVLKSAAIIKYNTLCSYK
jgi:hypothetical protein